MLKRKLLLLKHDTAKAVWRYFQGVHVYCSGDGRQQVEIYASTFTAWLLTTFTKFILLQTIKKDTEVKADS